MTHEYEISGMTCGHCVTKVKSELLKLGDITAADINLRTGRANVTMNGHVSTTVLQRAVEKAGPYSLAGVVEATPANNDRGEQHSSSSYYPIFLIFLYITGITLIPQFVSGDFNLTQWMSHFMAGFFLFFSFFKILNLKGFAEAYGTYDIIAKVFPAWGFIYPFAELILGLLFFTGASPLGTNIATFLLMGVSSIGVIRSLLKKQTFQCACLGTIIQLPLSKVTLVEDLLMVAMSGIMIININ